jgi:hypothetical protein
MKTIDLPPPSSGYYQSLRANSHTLSTAICDIIDNSYSADASKVWVAGRMGGDGPVLEILDDGVGMTREELIFKAMSFTSNRSVRRGKDLGKYGLGMKYAAFSQGRCLTVVTKRNGVVSIARWDERHLADGWTLQVDDIVTENSPLMAKLAGMESGTLVIISAIDRLGSTEPGDNGDEFFAAITETELHIAKTFSKMMNAGFSVFLGARKVSAVDPAQADEFTTTHIAPVFPKSGASLKISGYVVSPDHEREDCKQGLILIRKGRMIAHTGWCGLSKGSDTDSLTRLARVVIDIGSDDDDWSVNVEKSSFRIPANVRAMVKAYVAKVHAESRRMLEHRHGRAARAVSETGTSLWVPTGLTLQPLAINWDCTLLAQHLEGKSRKAVEEALHLAQKELPPMSFFQQDNLAATVVGEPEEVDEVECRIPADMISQVKVLVEFSLDQGDTVEEIAENLSDRFGCEISPRRVLELSGARK